MGIFAPAQRAWQNLRGRLYMRRAAQRVRTGMQVVHGPHLTKLAEHEVALVLVGRDVAYFLDHHIAHHRKLGVSHIVYVDNGSTDGSIDIARRWPDITIVTCDADFREHEREIRFQANTMVLEGGWRLAIDPDELLDYPNADRVPLPELARRMAARGHTALVAQMLDMAFDGPISVAGAMPYSEAAHSFDRYNIADLERFSYQGSDLSWAWFLDQNRVTNPTIPVLYGGLRRAAFGEPCCLTKHALFRMGDGVVPQPHPHVTTGVVCTDFSAVLRHYKLAGGVVAREQKLLAENRVAHDETRLRVSRLAQEGDLNLADYCDAQGPTVERLIAQDVLQITDTAREMLA